MSKPVVELLGRNGNAFSILGACSKAAKKAGIPEAEVKAILDEMMARDYDHLLATAQKYFEVE